nr:hypothetical protein [Dyella sp. ASV24]
MATSFLDDFRKSLAAVKDNPELLAPLIERFSQQSLFVPTTDPADVPEGKVGIRFIEIDGFPGVPTLIATPDRATAQALFHLEDERIMELHGAFILGLARGNRFVLVIKEGEDLETFEYERLLVLSQALALSSDSGPADSNPNTAREAYPQAFADWLYDYCRGQRDISDAWLALLSVGASDKPSVCVVLDNYAAASHDERIREQVHLLQPGQMLYEYSQLQGMTCNGNQDVVARIREQPPLYSRTHKQGWWARLQRRRQPAPLTWLHIDIRD